MTKLNGIEYNEEVTDKTKLQLLKMKLKNLKSKSRVNNYLATGAIVVGLTVGGIMAANEATVNHATDMCMTSKVISLFSEKEALEHQISGIKNDFKDASYLNIEHIENRYVAPNGYILNGDKCFKYVEPNISIVYSCPEGYILSGDKAYKVNSDGSKSIINATKQEVYAVPTGAVLKVLEDGRRVGVYEIAAEYQEEAIMTTADNNTYTLKLK